MLTPKNLLEQWVGEAVQTVVGIAPAGPLVRPTLDPRHGDFQSNVSMTSAKAVQANPRELAGKIAGVLAGKGMAMVEKPEIAGPGFINFRLTRGFIAEQALERFRDERLGIPKAASPRTIVLDFSSPNVAKEMHVGHLRSTVLGDALQRTFRFLGHRVISDNHLGDWGTQFGVVILAFKKFGREAELVADPLGHLGELYREMNKACEADEAARAAAREELLKLQQGDPENRALWERFVSLSKASMNSLYARLGVQFDTTLGESFYNDLLPLVAADLEREGVARESEGAKVVFFDEDERLKDHPFLIQKSDGAFLYSTTDLATLACRIRAYRPDQILYVTDGRQQMHFQQLFAAARRWSKTPLPQVEHVWFGAILGEDRKPWKSREGDTIKLRELLDEAEERAARILAEKGASLASDEKAAIARAVGIGAIKYADLGQNRNLDYVFDWDKLLAFDGNTAPYLQNAYVRTRAIFRKANLETSPQPDALVLTHPAEIELAKRLLDFGDSVHLAAGEARPHYLCAYLFELAALLHKFWENCPVLKDEVPPETRDTRLVLCDLTGRTLKLGLYLLGIETVERM